MRSNVDEAPLKLVKSGQRRSHEFPAPIAKLLGLRLIKAEDGQATVEFEASVRHANAMGTLQGGVICALANLAMGAAYQSVLSDGENFTALELKIDFLHPVWNTLLLAEARLVNAGRPLALVE